MKGNLYKATYGDNVICDGAKMTAVPYWVVKYCLEHIYKVVSFEEFRDKFIEIKKIIGGDTQFLLESKNVRDDGSNNRVKNYYTEKRPYLVHTYNGIKTEFGVFTQWKNNNENSNFARFSKAINSLGFIITERDNVLGDEVNVGEEDDEMDETEQEILMTSGFSPKYVIAKIANYIECNNFYYTKNSLSNFYLSLKTKPFVILAGISGTGKSKLVKLFAEAIGATSKNGQYNLISVKPDWNDSTELLGYKNIKDEFVAGELLDIIQEAQRNENKNKPYFVCLDEMNLARVEYYLSEYLSIIESREFSDGGEIVTDKIFSDKYLGDSENNKAYKGLIFPENLYIIGTVNMDDTTFSFSKKVLDRANTIEFSDVDLDLLDFKQGESEAVQVDNSFIKTRYLNIKNALEADEAYVKEVNEKVVEINNILKPYSKHFAYRVRDEIVFYMLENKLSELLEEDVAFDYQIKQKILPTIIGSDECLKDILFKLYKYCVPDVDLNPEVNYVEQSMKYLEKAKYKQSAEKISMMLRGYRDGYTSFWI